MRIAVIAFDFPQPSETFVLRHVERLHADVVCEWSRPHLFAGPDLLQNVFAAQSGSPTIASSPVRLVSKGLSRLRGWIQPASQFAWNPSMRRHWRQYLDRRRPDVVLAEFAPNALEAMSECRRRGIPLVAHFHGFDATSLMRNPAYRRALPELFENAAAVVCISRFMRDVLLQAGCPASKLHVIPCGAPLSEFSFSTNPGVQPCRFIAVSRLVPVKGPMITLRAFREVCSQRPDVRLTFVGDGPLRHRLEEDIRKYSLEDLVSITGFLPNSCVRNRLASSCVFVQASIRDKRGAIEGWGVSLAEAMATGLPAVVSRCGGMVDLVNDGCQGLLFEEGDWRGMAQRMLKLADDPELRLKMGRAARDRVEQVGNAERSLTALEEVLHESAGNPIG